MHWKVLKTVETRLKDRRSELFHIFFFVRKTIRVIVVARYMLRISQKWEL